jgi:hypothetical protein
MKERNSRSGWESNLSPLECFPNVLTLTPFHLEIQLVTKYSIVVFEDFIVLNIIGHVIYQLGRGRKRRDEREKERDLHLHPF